MVVNPHRNAIMSASPPPRLRFIFASIETNPHCLCVCVIEPSKTFCGGMKTPRGSRSTYMSLMPSLYPSPTFMPLITPWRASPTQTNSSRKSCDRLEFSHITQSSKETIFSIELMRSRVCIKKKNVNPSQKKKKRC